MNAWNVALFLVMLVFSAVAVALSCHFAQMRRRSAEFDVDYREATEYIRRAGGGHVPWRSPTGKPPRGGSYFKA